MVSLSHSNDIVMSMSISRSFAMMFIITTNTVSPDYGDLGVLLASLRALD